MSETTEDKAHVTTLTLRVGPESQKAAVIGAGAWGTALANLLASKGMPVKLWAYEREVVEAIHKKRENTLFLPGIKLHPNITPTGSLPDAIRQCTLIVFAVPSHVARPVLNQLTALLSSPVAFINATKGIEEDTLLLMSDVMKELLLPMMQRAVVVLSGPSFAQEVSKGLPTAVTLAGEEPMLVKRVQGLLMTPTFRVYTVRHGRRATRRGVEERDRHRGRHRGRPEAGIRCARRLDHARAGRNGPPGGGDEGGPADILRSLRAR